MKWLKKGILTIIFTITLVQPVYASELIKGAATAYCLYGTTASGEPVHDGICASSKDRIGATIALYQRLPDDSVGELIGVYECKDTGATKGIKSGYVVDVWRPDYACCKEFMRRVYANGCKGKVYIQILESEN